MRQICLAVLVFLAIACQPTGNVEIVIDKPESRRLLAYYFGGYADADPFAVGLLMHRDGRYYVDPDRLEALKPGMGARLESYLHRRRLVWDSLAAFVQATYYDIRRVPGTIAALKADWPPEDAESFEVHGPMTGYKRRIHVPERALRAALKGFDANGKRLLYPPGTAIWAEHDSSGIVVETTVMLRRTDGFWDFATYDSSGMLAVTTRPKPRALLTPTECVGCHFGTKQFDPERSFPHHAAEAPDGLREWYTSERDGEVVRYFDEHARRSDTVLGLYNTVFVSKLRASRDAGLITETDAAMLVELGL